MDEKQQLSAAAERELRALQAIEALQAELDEVDRDAREPIAIVGAACRLPGNSSTPKAFWELLHGGRSATREAPANRWPRRPDGAPSRTWRAGFLEEDVKAFDARFFGISPREAAAMDPQQRLALEVSWEALEDAGLAIDPLVGADGGVVFATSAFDHLLTLAPRVPTEALPYFVTGSILSGIPNRISYCFNLRGPSLAVDTACSSGLVALDHACHALRMRRAPFLLVGGIGLLISEEPMRSFDAMGAMSPDGRCKTFDAKADGMTRGEGCVVFVMKRLRDAIAAKDQIWALVHATAVNHNGRGPGLTVPSSRAQETVIQTAMRDGDIDANNVGYIEAHGTGTHLGDPIEAEAVAASYTQSRTEPLYIGSSKTNIGHLEAAAGVAGLLKLVLSLGHKEIPPSLHFEEQNPHIPLEEMRLRVPTRVEPWRAPAKGPRLGAVTAIGVGGTNAHAIVGEYVETDAQPSTAVEPPVHAIALSARSDAALRARIEQCASYLETTTDDLTAIGYTSCRRRYHDQHRAVVVGTNRAELAQALRTQLRASPAAGVWMGTVDPGIVPKCVFVFPGQGSQWVGMGRELLSHHPAFRRVIEACEESFAPHVDWSLIKELEGRQTPSRLDEVQVIQPVLFAIQVGLCEVLKEWGIKPAALIGHSMGEVAAAHVSGALSLRDAAAVICSRSRLITTGLTGTMAAVELTADEVAAEVAKREGRISLAACNGPRATIIAGETREVGAFLEELQARGVFCRPIKNSVATHSAHVEKIRDRLLADLAKMEPKATPSTFRSTALEKAPGRLDGEYWFANCRQPVRFLQRVKELVGSGHTTFIELSPHPVLSHALGEIGASLGTEIRVTCPMKRERPERQTVLEAIAYLHCGGTSIDWSPVYPEGRVVSLPPYPWQREHLEVVRARSVDRELAQPSLRPLVGRRLSTLGDVGNDVFETRIDTSAPELAYLKGHRVGKEVWLPAAGFAETALQVLDVLGASSFALEALEVPQALVLPEENPVTLQTVHSRDVGGARRLRFASQTSGSGADGAYTVHAAVRVVPASGERPSTFSLDEIRRRCATEVDAERYYASLAEVGAFFEGSFKGIVKLVHGEGEALGQLGTEADETGYHVHPARLDAALQVSGALLPADRSATFVAVGIERIEVHGAAANARYSYVRARPSTGDHPTAFDLWLLDEQGEAMVSVTGLTVKSLGSTRDALEPLLYETQWVPSPTSSAEDLSGAWLVVGEPRGLADEVSRSLASRGAKVARISVDAEAQSSDKAHVVIRGRSRDEYARALRELFPGEPPRRILHLAGVDAPAALDGASLTRAGHARLASAIYLVQAVAAMPWATPPRLVFVTRGAQPAGGSSNLQRPEQALAGGFAATLTYEHPELEPTTVDLDPSGSADDLCAALARLDAETRVALRKGERFVARLRSRAAPAMQRRRRTITPNRDASYRLEVSKPGRLDSLVLRPDVPRKPERGEVQIRVRASCLNFRDVLVALGETFAEGASRRFGVDSIGSDCAGEVLAVGEGVTEHRVGDLVMAIGTNAYSGVVTVQQEFVVGKPSGLSLAQAAALPTAYLTAIYSLEEHGQLKAGESVLIHSASGGVGLAAIEYAKLVGARILTTAGTTGKRDFLKSLGITSVFDSRSADWLSNVMQTSGGRGVDVVLNSLAGEALHAGVSALAPFGRFVELGKRDVYGDTRVTLHALRQNARWSAVAIEELVVHRPAEVARILRRTKELLDEGRIRPLPVEEFGLSQITDAFQHMAGARHIGRIVVVHEDSAAVVDDAFEVPVKADRSYVVTGGFGGLGLVVAERLVDLGCRHLVLSGRSSPSARASAKIDALRARASIDCVLSDVSKKEDVDQLIASASKERPIGGVVHVAGGIDDAAVTNIAVDRLDRMFAAKLLGTHHVLSALEGARPDFCVLFSSLAAVLGSAGQATYSAANAYLDAVAVHARERGVPATSVSWGAWADVGGATSAEQIANLVRGGVKPMSPTLGADLFERVLASPTAHVVAAEVDWGRWREANPSAAGLRFLEEMRSVGKTETSADRVALRAQLAAQPSVMRIVALREHVREALATVLRLAPDTISRTAPFKSLGLDSILLLSLRNVLEEELGFRLSAATVLANATIDALAAHLDALFVAEGGGAQAAAVHTPPVEEVQEVVVPEDADEVRKALEAELEELDG